MSEGGGEVLPFLEPDAVAMLTGYRQKGRQIEQLRVIFTAAQAAQQARPAQW